MKEVVQCLEYTYQSANTISQEFVYREKEHLYCELKFDLGSGD